jgi:hypothetical protein
MKSLLIQTDEDSIIAVYEINVFVLKKRLILDPMQKLGGSIV